MLLRSCAAPATPHSILDLTHSLPLLLYLTPRLVPIHAPRWQAARRSWYCRRMELRQSERWRSVITPFYNNRVVDDVHEWSDAQSLVVVL